MNLFEGPRKVLGRDEQLVIRSRVSVLEGEEPYLYTEGGGSKIFK